MDELRDTGDLLEVPENERDLYDPHPLLDLTHAAFGDGGPDDVSDVPEGEDIDPATFQED